MKKKDIFKYVISIGAIAILCMVTGIYADISFSPSDLFKVGSESAGAVIDSDGSIDCTGDITLGDDITINDDLTVGGDTAISGTLGVTGTTTLSDTTFGDQDITNVGNIALDSISSDAGTSVTVTLGTDAGDDFIVAGSTFVVSGDSGYVGLGTNAPTSRLQVVDGDITFTYNLVGAHFIDYRNTSAVAGAAINNRFIGAAGELVQLLLDADGHFTIDNETLNTNGYVSIKSSATERVRVTAEGETSFLDNAITNVGDIGLDSISSDAGTTVAVTLGTDAGDDFTVAGSTFVVSGDSGFVGIGDATPVVELDIAGEIGLAVDLDTASAPARTGILGITAGFDLYVSTGTGAGQWELIGSQS